VILHAGSKKKENEPVLARPKASFADLLPYAIKEHSRNIDKALSH